jgi:hypothetical protein
MFSIYTRFCRNATCAASSSISACVRSKHSNDFVYVRKW